MAVEFALVATLFLSVVFGMLELSRAMYLWNTLQEVTRRAARAAAVSDFSDAAAMDALRRRALFRSGAGELPLGAPVTDAHLRIDYLSLALSSDGSLTPTPIAGAALPANPAANLRNCGIDPYGASCIRYVRVRLCAPGADACGAVPYQTLVSLIHLPLSLPVSTTVTPAESLGFVPGTAPGPAP